MGKGWGLREAASLAECLNKTKSSSSNQIRKSVLKDFRIEACQRFKAIWESKNKQRKMSKDFCFTCLHEIYRENSILGL